MGGARKIILSVNALPIPIGITGTCVRQQVISSSKRHRNNLSFSSMLRRSHAAQPVAAQTIAISSAAISAPYEQRNDNNEESLCITRRGRKTG